MHDHANEPTSYNPNRLLDTLLIWLNVSSDKKLSRVLQISLTIIQNIRTGSVPVRAVVLYRMAECAGKSMEELRLVLGDRRRKVRVL